MWLGRYISCGVFTQSIIAVVYVRIFRPGQCAWFLKIVFACVYVCVYTYVFLCLYVMQPSKALITIHIM